MYGEATGKGAKFLEAPVSGSKVRAPRLPATPSTTRVWPLLTCFEGLVNIVG